MNNIPAMPIQFTVDEFAHHLGCSEGAVRKMITNKIVKTTGDGGQLRISARENWLAAKNYLGLIQSVQEGLAEAQNKGLIKVVGLGDEGEIDYERTDKD
jgi:hypothetical protein